MKRWITSSIQSAASPRYPKRVFEVRPPWLLIGLGATVGLLSLLQLFADPESYSIQVIEVGVPLALSIPVLYVALQVYESPDPGGFQANVFLLSLLFALIGGSTVELVLWSEIHQGGQIPDVYFPIAMSLGAGVSVGSVFGMMLNDLGRTRKDLADEVHRTRTLNQQLKVINRVLRHNVRNSLTVAFGALDQLQAELNEPRLERLVISCRYSLDRLRDRVDKALYIEDLGTIENKLSVVDLARVITDQLEELHAQYDGVQIQTDLPDEAAVRAHPLVGVAVGEVIENAIQHNDSVDARIHVGFSKSNGVASMNVADNGPGITNEEINHLQAGVETQMQHSSGVGLWLVKWIAEESGGELRLSESQELGGQLVKLEFPQV